MCTPSTRKSSQNEHTLHLTGKSTAGETIPGSQDQQNTAWSDCRLWGSALTPWTIVTTTSSLDKALDETAITQARFTRPAIDKQMILEMALASFAIYII